jgi:hypothetical protein
MKTKYQEIKPILSLEDDSIAKKFMEHGMSKPKAYELYVHFFEIERFLLGVRYNIAEILDSKNKKQMIEQLDDIWGDLDSHMIKGHFTPMKNLLNTWLFLKQNEKYMD